MVGVDALFRRLGPGGREIWCHLVCDDFSLDGLEELHRMAGCLGLPRWRLHDPPGKPRPHYDLTPELRVRALELGAVELTRRELVIWLHRGRATLAFSRAQLTVGQVVTDLKSGLVLPERD